MVGSEPKFYPPRAQTLLKKRRRAVMEDEARKAEAYEEATSILKQPFSIS